MQPQLDGYANCGNAEPHMFHLYDADVLHKCTGVTTCGVMEHDPHEFVRREQLWCSGICECGIIKEIHGPGRHK